MVTNRASRTAEYMAFFRALESGRPDGRRLFVDRLAERFLRPSLKMAVRASRWPMVAGIVNLYVDWRLPGARTSAIARTALIDDALAEALRDEIRQVVILGAGFDCRAYRLSEMAGSKVFEVDHPSTLATKLRVLRDALPGIPGNVKFVEIDFNQDALPDVLGEAGLLKSERAVFLWEGVTNYLTADAVDSVLRLVASCGVGSRVIFTYVHAGLMDGSVRFDGGERLLRDVAEIGEPWTFGIVSEELEEFLKRRGLRLKRDLSANEYRREYFGASAKRMKGYEFYHVAIAEVGDGQGSIEGAERLGNSG